MVVVPEENDAGDGFRGGRFPAGPASPPNPLADKGL